MRWRVAAALLLVVVALGAFNYLRPIPSVAATALLPSTDRVAGGAPALPWPARGAAAVGRLGPGFIAHSGHGTGIPPASVTKVMTALVVLTDKPLKKGETGPTITMTDADVQAYQTDLKSEQSVVKVETGEQLTEFQVLQGMLIPSANNLADTLARWDAGSIDAFVSRMNARAAAMHLRHTKFADTSGASAASVSTPSDLLALGMVAMQDPVFAQVVGQAQADLPVAGTVFNVNGVLGQNGIVGIKTGSGLNTGANFLFAASVTVDNREIFIYGCVMGQPSLAIAFAGAKALVGVVSPARKERRVVVRNQSVGDLDFIWVAATGLVSAVEVDLCVSPGLVLLQHLNVSR